MICSLDLGHGKEPLMQSLVLGRYLSGPVFWSYSRLSLVPRWELMVNADTFDRSNGVPIK